MDPAVSRQTWRTLEPVPAMVYFAPEAQEEYTALGLDVKANLALPAWEKIGTDGCARLRELVRPLAAAVVAGGGFPLSKGPGT